MKLNRLTSVSTVLFTRSSYSLRTARDSLLNDQTSSFKRQTRDLSGTFSARRSNVRAHDVMINTETTAASGTDCPSCCSASKSLLPVVTFVTLHEELVLVKRGPKSASHLHNMGFLISEMYLKAEEMDGDSPHFIQHEPVT